MYSTRPKGRVFFKLKYSRKIKFQFEGSVYEFNVPFGLNTAPIVFTKVMKPVVKLLKACGYLSTIYSDDICLIGHNYEICSKIRN